MEVGKVKEKGFLKENDSEKRKGRKVGEDGKDKERKEEKLAKERTRRTGRRGNAAGENIAEKRKGGWREGQCNRQVTCKSEKAFQGYTATRRKLYGTQTASCRYFGHGGGCR